MIMIIKYIYNTFEIKLYVFIIGDLRVQFTEDVCARFKAYGWQVLKVEDGDNDLNAIANAIEEAKKDHTRPSLIYVRYLYTINDQ